MTITTDNGQWAAVKTELAENKALVFRTPSGLATALGNHQAFTNPNPPATKQSIETLLANNRTDSAVIKPDLKSPNGEQLYVAASRYRQNNAPPSGVRGMIKAFTA